VIILVIALTVKNICKEIQPTHEKVSKISRSSNEKAPAVRRERKKCVEPQVLEDYVLQLLFSFMKRLAT
jgi:hypothetical protein